MKYKIIGLYQLITGVFGAILIAFNITKVLKHTDTLPVFILGLLLFAGVAYSGYALLNKLNNALKYSIWAQTLQIISFTYSGAQYLFTGSAFFALVYKNSIALESQIAPIAFNISKVSVIQPFELRIYIVPLILVLLLTKK